MFKIGISTGIFAREMPEDELEHMVLTLLMSRPDCIEILLTRTFYHKERQFVTKSWLFYEKFINYQSILLKNGSKRLEHDATFAW